MTLQPATTPAAAACIPQDAHAGSGRPDGGGGATDSGMAGASHRGMIDFLLVLASVAFFAGSWAYVRFCARLGGAP